MLTPTADNPADPHAATTAGRSLQGSQEPNDPRDNGHSKIKPWITPGTGKTHLSIALAVQAARRGHRVAFATAHQWVNRLDAAARAGRLDQELERLRRIPLLVFALVSSRYEHASMIVSSNKPFSSWAEIFGDAVAVAAMVDRPVHHAEIVSLKGDSYRLKDRRKEVASAE
jgi:DNA replication protein DnaC